MKKVDAVASYTNNDSFGGMPPMGGMGGPIPPITPSNNDDGVIDVVENELVPVEEQFPCFKNYKAFENNEWIDKNETINNQEELDSWNDKLIDDDGILILKDDFDKWLEKKENDKLKDITIRTATPFIINTNSSNGKDIATITFLCVLENDKIITISRNFILEDDLDKQIVEGIDFHANSEFINNKICYNFIAKYLPAYFSNFKFKVDNLNNNEKCNLVTLECIEIENRSNVINFRMNSEIYSSMNFIDDYVFKGEIENSHDLQLATVIGSKVNDNVEFFLVEQIENIVTMVSTKKKAKGVEAVKEIFSKKEEDTNIGVVFRVSRTFNGNKEIVSILTPFDIGVVLDKSKFKGDTVESLEENYYGDSDQYVATLTVDDARLEGIDKSYMTIRGKTKDGITKIFLLDSAVKNDLIHKIKEY